MRARLKRAAKALASGLAIVVGLSLVCALLLLVPGVRHKLLAEALTRANENLPGTLSVERAQWQSLRSLSLRGVNWVDASDTLLVAEELSGSFSLAPLLRSQIVLPKVTLDGVRGDVDALTTALSTPEPASVSREPEPFTWPALKITDLRMNAGAIELQEGQRLDRAQIRASLDLIDGPSLDLQELQASGNRGEWQLDSRGFQIDLERGMAHGALQGQFAGELPLEFHLRASGEEPLRLEVLSAELTGGERFALEGTLETQPGRVVDAKLTLRTPGVLALRKFAPTAESVASLADLTGVTVDLEARTELDSDFATSFVARLHAKDWIDHGLVQGRYSSASTTLDSLALGLRGLVLEADARLSGNTLSTHVQLRAPDTRWMSLLRDPPPIEELRVAADVMLEGNREAPTLTATLEASGASEGRRLDRLQLSARSESLFEQPLHVVLRAEAENTGLAMQAVAEGREPWRVQLSPVRISAAPKSMQTPRLGSTPGRLEISSKARSVKGENVRIEGDAGSHRVSATIDSTRAIRFQLSSAFPVPPPLGMRSIEMAASDRDTLEAEWPRETGLTARGTIALDTGALDIEGEWKAPGPSHLRKLIPATARVEDLGLIRADFRAKSAGKSDSLTARIDLRATEWLDEALLRTASLGDGHRIEALRIRGLGLQLEAEGEVEDRWNLEGHFRVDDADLIARFAPGVVDSLELDVEGTLRGSRESPQVNAILAGRVRGRDFFFPQLAGTVVTDADSLVATVRTGKGRWQDYEGSAIELRLESAPRVESGKVMAQVTTGDLALDTETSFSRTELLQLTTESLRIEFDGLDLETTQPFQVDLEGGQGELRALSLAGTLGRLDLDAAWGPDRLELEGNGELTLPDSPPLVAIPSELWPRQITGSVAARHPLDIDLQLRVKDLPWASRVLSVDLESRSRADSTWVELHAREGEVDRLSLVATLPTGETIFDLSAEGATARGEFQCFPLPLGTNALRSDNQELGCLDGLFALDPRAANHAADAQLSLSFPGWNRLAAYRLDLTTRATGTIPGETSTEGARAQAEADLVLLRAENPVLNGTARYQAAAPRDTVGAEIAVDLRAPSLRLADFAELLPPDIDLTGTLDLELAAKGALSNPQLEGRIRGPVEFHSANGTRVQSTQDLTIGGDLERPSLKGQVRVDRGTIQIPAPPKALHPTQGDSELWKLARHRADSNTARVEAVPAPKPGTALRDIDVRVVIPSGFWIRGRGLETELGGTLQVEQRGAAPSLRGNLDARRGSLLLLGRNFTFERGGVTFEGTEEINPELDLSMVTKVSDYRIRVVVGGTAQKPTMRLESEPELPEADIVSYLLFGRAVNELDTDQTSFLESRATEVAASMGLAGLEARIARELGVDMLKIKRGEGASRVVLGKYLSPKVLLQYEQSLSEGDDSSLNIEYLLFQGFKIESLLARASQSGLGLTWEKGY